MWARISSFIIRHRVIFAIIIVVITAFMGYKAKDVKLSYDFPQVIPNSDPDFINYTQFKKQFGEDGDLFIIGFQSKEVFKKDVFNSWRDIAEKVKKLQGVKTVATVSNLMTLEKDTSTHRFTIKPLVTKPLATQEEADSIKDVILSLPFYKNLFYNDSTHATLMAIKLDQRALLTKAREPMFDSVRVLATRFSEQNHVKLYYTGLPYIRTLYGYKVLDELNLFLALSILITSIILYLFFRSWTSVLFPMVIIGIIIALTMGYVAILDYRLTLLTALIPPLIVIIAVPNFIYFLNRYHTEYKKYGDKLTGINMMVQNIAKIVFLNNITTAIGFGVLFFVDSPVLKEFGIIAFLMITTTYFATLTIMPLVFSFLPAPSEHQTKYLENRIMKNFIEGVVRYINTKRTLVYSIAIGIGIISAVGVTKLHALGYIMDDIPHNDRLYVDMKFFEDNFKGVMPFEIILNTGKPDGALDPDVLTKIQQIQDTLAKMPEFSTTISVADVAKYANQSFYNGRPSRYSLPSRRDLTFLLRYMPEMDLSKVSDVGFSVTDSTKQLVRISTKMADVGSIKLEQIVKKLDKDIKIIWDDDKMKPEFTGFSLIFLKGNTYLIQNLVFSLAMAIVLIIIVIVIMFPTARLVLITLIPNCLALLITAGLMGFLNIPLKPSSVLVFTIAFGIAIDMSFHFLVNYRQDLKLHNWDVLKTVDNTMRITGFSMVYTSLVLFFGFFIFCFSSFGSTIALGALTSLTIFCAMFSNIIVIPALLVSFDKKGKREKV
jgi:uncharacterized protein